MRKARFQSLLLQLAMVAAVLMAAAPVVSRWLQAQHGQMQMSMQMSGMTAAPMGKVAADPHAAHHAMHGSHEHAAPAVPNTPQSHPSAPDPHAAHGEACDYCTMASRLLPWLAVLLVLAPLLYRLVPTSPRCIQLPSSLHWPAHPARGPPLFC